MRHIVMHKVDAKMEANIPPGERIMKEMGGFIQEQLKSGVFLDGAGLHRSAVRARVRASGKDVQVTKGPYAGGNELIAGMAMTVAKGLDGAVAQAKGLLQAMGGGEIEVGPVVEPWDLGFMAKPDGAAERFLLLQKGDAAFEAGAPRPAAEAKFLAQLKADGALQSAARLAPSKRGLRLRGGTGKRTWTDGPFTESKELIAGYSIISLPTREAVVAWAERYAGILDGNEVDVREVLDD